MVQLSTAVGHQISHLQSAHTWFFSDRRLCCMSSLINLPGLSSWTTHPPTKGKYIAANSVWNFSLQTACFLVSEKMKVLIENDMSNCLIFCTEDDFASNFCILCSAVAWKEKRDHGAAISFSWHTTITSVLLTTELILRKITITENYN